MYNEWKSLNQPKNLFQNYLHSVYCLQQAYKEALKIVQKTVISFLKHAVFTPCKFNKF